MASFREFKYYDWVITKPKREFIKADLIEIFAEIVIKPWEFTAQEKVARAMHEALKTVDYLMK
jgi:hypothetical protein